MESYRLIRSRRRTLALEIDREGTVVVRAPAGLPQGEIDRFVTAHEQWVRSHLERQRAWLAAHPEPDAEEEARLRSLAREVLPGRVEYFSKLMGVRPTGVKITSARGRFGSCSGKNSICFSWRLMAYPMEAVDYVVVHELAHITHKTTDGTFTAVWRKSCPTGRSRRALLKG